MNDIDNRDEKDKKPKEYYQINLDMGRIFWIVFLLGVVIIGIFVLGFFVGGGREKSTSLSIGNKGKRESGEVIVNKIFGEEKSKPGVSDDKNEVDIEEIFKKHPESEIQVVDKKSVQEALETSKKEIKPNTEVNVHKKYTRQISNESKTAKTSKSAYRPVGNYYIQVASFKKKENALKLKSELEKNLYRVEIVKVQINGETYYRVRVGPFLSSTIAKNTMIAMKRRFNLDAPFVVKKGS